MTKLKKGTSKLKKGTRVKDIDGFLGKGTVIRRDRKIKYLIRVKWDKNPPKKYNGGSNPCFTFDENLIKIKKKK